MSSRRLNLVILRRLFENLQSSHLRASHPSLLLDYASHVRFAIYLPYSHTVALCDSPKRRFKLDQKFHFPQINPSHLAWRGRCDLVIASLIFFFFFISLTRHIQERPRLSSRALLPWLINLHLPLVVIHSNIRRGQLIQL